MLREYTPEKPLVIYADREESAEARRAEFAELFQNFGAVKVWHNMEIGGPPAIWVTAPPNMRPPNWRSGESVIITDPACLVVKTPLPPKHVVRTYMDLELFKLAAELAGVEARIGVWLADRRKREEGTIDFEESDFGDFPEYLCEVADDGFDVTAIAVILHHERTAYDGQGSREGTEEYEIHLPIVARSPADDLFVPADLQTPLTSWLVQIDETAMEPDLVSWPKVAECTEAWRHPDVLEVKYEEPEDAEEDDQWIAGFMVDGEFISAGDFEDVSLYEKPDDQFVWEECATILRRVLSIGLRREFMREETEQARGLDEKAQPVWRVVNKYGEEIR